jgi:Glycosyl transferase family 11
MILLICPFGLANRLLYFTHCITLAETTGHRVICLNIPEATQFESGHYGTLCTWPPTSFPRIKLPNFPRRCLTLIFRKFIDFCRYISLPKPAIFWPTVATADQVSADNPDFQRVLRSHRLIILTGWISVEKMVVPNPQIIRTFFTPVKAIRQLSQETAQRAKEGADILVGIHIRWGDFSLYRNGAYYFSVEVYLRVMKKCLELFPEKRVAFLLVSDEPRRLAESLESFAPLKVALGPGSALGDLYTLAECDYIICPASTFSLWSAFYGKKPCWCLRNSTVLPELGDFYVPDTRFEGLHP